mmetsp:Transcript_75782/g.214245  ORF Transcript_75782/g.214245 Transcript_75782/m.214245 type:complete len:333 (-) Transcript_75782:609-1607(-)
MCSPTGRDCATSSSHERVRSSMVPPTATTHGWGGGRHLVLLQRPLQMRFDIREALITDSKLLKHNVPTEVRDALLLGTRQQVELAQQVVCLEVPRVVFQVWLPGMQGAGEGFQRLRAPCRVLPGQVACEGILRIYEERVALECLGELAQGLLGARAHGRAEQLQFRLQVPGLEPRHAPPELALLPPLADVLGLELQAHRLDHEVMPLQRDAHGVREVDHRVVPALRHVDDVPRLLDALPRRPPASQGRVHAMEPIQDWPAPVDAARRIVRGVVQEPPLPSVRRHLQGRSMSVEAHAAPRPPHQEDWLRGGRREGTVVPRLDHRRDFKVDALK